MNTRFQEMSISAKLREIAGDLAQIAANPPNEMDSQAMARLSSQLLAVAGQVALGESIDHNRPGFTDERPFARMLAVAHLRLNAIEPALRTIIEQHDKDGCIASGAFDAGRDALKELDESKAREATRG